MSSLFCKTAGSPWDSLGSTMDECQTILQGLSEVGPGQKCSSVGRIWATRAARCGRGVRVRPAVGRVCSARPRPPGAQPGSIAVDMSEAGGSTRAVSGSRRSAGSGRVAVFLDRIDDGLDVRQRSCFRYGPGAPEDLQRKSCRTASGSRGGRLAPPRCSGSLPVSARAPDAQGRGLRFARRVGSTS